MEIAAAVDILATLLTTVTNAVAQMGTVSGMIQKAKAEGRTTFNDEEWAAITATQTMSRQQLLDAINKALPG